MSEATKICSQCGKELAADSVFCPHCGAKQTAAEGIAPPQPVAAAAVEPPAPNRYQEMLDKVLATTRTHKWYWAGGGGAAVVIAVLAILFFTGIFGPSGRAICTAALTQAKDFGVISPSATLSSTSAKSTDVDGRRQCAAEAGGDSYVLLADIKNEDAEHKKCKDFAKQADCLKLYSVARTDGMTTYQVREIPPGETDEALLGTQAAPGQAAGSSADAGGSDALDAQTAVDNGGAGAPDQTAPDQTAPAQAAPADQPQQ